jgi:hypothetical protein
VHGALGGGTMLYQAKSSSKLFPQQQRRGATLNQCTFAAIPMLSDPGRICRFQCPPCGHFRRFGEELLKEYDSGCALCS